MSTTKSLFRDEINNRNGTTVPINKGHFSLDTEKRIKIFTDKLSNNWER